MADPARSSTSDAGTWISAALFLVVAIAILATGFARNGNCLLQSLDGAAWRVQLAAQVVDRIPFSQTGADPYQGSFDAYYPVFREYLLPGALGLLAGDGMPGTAATFTIYAAFLLLASYVFARAAGVERPAALVGSFLLPLMALPVFPHRNAYFYPQLSINPHIAQIVALSLLIVACFWALDPRAGRARLLLIPVPTILFLLAVLSLVPYVSLMVPATALYGGASFLSAARVRDNWARLVAGLLMIAVPAALGVVTYLHGLIGYTAYQFFSGDFEQMRSSLMFASTLFWITPAGKVAIPLGLAGALWLFFTRSGRLRLLAATHLIVTILYLVTAYLIVRFATSYQGPSPVYFEICFWAYSLLMCGVAVVAAARLVARLLGFIFNAPNGWLARHGGIVLVTLAPLLALGTGAWARAFWPDECGLRSFAPIRGTAITNELHQALALEPGAPFRGLAATIDGSDGRPSVDWFTLFSHDAEVWRATGNDHHVVGLWHFGIPTLFQYFTFITPPYYLMLTDFLARPADRQARSVVVLTRIDAPMMQLWGVRDVITDMETTVGTEIASVPLPDNPKLRLVELPHPNLGDYSPTEPQQVDSFRAGLGVLHDPRFDGSRTVVTTGPLSGPFVPAAGVALTYESYGFRLVAESAGRSLLVLPMQYSHCWTSEGTGQSQLFRADLLQLGIAFQGHLDTRLVFRFGPILAGECRVQDLDDMGRLKISEARGTPARGGPSQ